MTKTIQTTNQYGGRDYRYRILCDVCGEPYKRTKKGKEEVVEFLTSGEEQLTAAAAGWIVEGKTAICDKCIKTIGV